MGVSQKLLGGGTMYRDCSPYPQCKIFNCCRSRAVKNLCCAFCVKPCADKCLNSPDRCGMCVLPNGKGMKEVWELTDDKPQDLPDAPDIERAERTGLRPGEVPFEEEDVKCPVCGQVCETVYLNVYNEPVGCERCVWVKDAAEWHELMETKDN